MRWHRVFIVVIIVALFLPSVSFASQPAVYLYIQKLDFPKVTIDMVIRALKFSLPRIDLQKEKPLIPVTAQIDEIARLQRSLNRSV